MGSNIPICACNRCSNIGIVAVPIDSRGGRLAYLCLEHATKSGDYPYGTRNTTTIGTPKANGETFGYEFETDSATQKARGEFLCEGFLPTHDGSIGDTEFVSPMQYGLGSLSAFATSIEKLYQNGDIYAGRSCGTHCHIGSAEFNRDNMDAIRARYGQIFAPLCDAMERDSDKMREIFGRTFREAGGYADRIERGAVFDCYYHSARYHFANLMHGNRIEYRLIKFRSAAQFVTAVKLCRAFNRAIVKNFVPYIGSPQESRKADVTAGKLVQLWNKCEIEPLDD